MDFHDKNHFAVCRSQSAARPPGWVRRKGTIMLNEFKAFIARGNVLDLAVAVIIGAAFGKIVTSLTEDLVMPLIGAVFGKVDFSSLFVVLGAVPPTYKGSLADYAALK